MKNQLILAFAMLFVFGLATATFASTGCGRGDSCPMMKTETSGKATTSCCDDCDCCKGNAVKTVGAYFKGQPLYYKTSKSSCKCCGSTKS